MKKDMIIVPFHDYKKWLCEGFRTRDSHLYEHFRENEAVEKILIINRPVSLAEVLIKHKSWKTNVGTILCKENNWQLIQIDEKTFCIDFFLFDFINVIKEKKKWWYTAFNYKTIQDAIKKAIKYIEMKDIVLFLENPMAVGIIGKLEEDLFVFDAIDNWLYHPQMKKNHELIKKNYELIEEKADFIFTVSQELLELFNKNKNTLWVPNGVDKEQFKISIVKEDEKRKEPVIGYMGKIQDRVDFDLIEQCLQRFCNNRFIIMGPIYAQKDRIKKIIRDYKNVSFIGDVHYDKLPAKMKEIDIGIIPHKVDKFTNSMNPLKIYEYLAAGKQVVTMNVAGTDGISEYVYKSNTYEQFIENIENAINQYKQTENVSEKILSTLQEEQLWKHKSDTIIKQFAKIKKL